MTTFQPGESTARTHLYRAQRASRTARAILREMRAGTSPLSGNAQAKTLVLARITRTRELRTARAILGCQERANDRKARPAMSILDAGTGGAS